MSTGRGKCPRCGTKYTIKGNALFIDHPRRSQVVPRKRRSPRHKRRGWPGKSWWIERAKNFAITTAVLLLLIAFAASTLP